MEKKFYISVTETLNRVVAVNAESIDEAIDKVKKAWKDGTVELNSKDFVENNFEDETQEVESSIAEGIIDASHYQLVK